MKKLFTTYLLLFALVFPFTIYSQNFIDEEIDGLAEKIAAKVDAKNDRLKKRKRVNVILVEDFTDTEGKISKLGASLAEEFSLALSGAGISFSVTGAKDLAEAPKRKRFNINKALNGVGKIADGVTDDLDYEQNRKARDATKSIGGAVDIGTSMENNRGRYKGIDAVVTGTLTESNDQYRLLIKVISTKKGYAMITSDKGFITKTPFILALEEEENNRRQTTTVESDSFTSRGSGSSSLGRGSVQQTFSSNNTEVELLEVKQSGQKLECRVRIKNIGPDLNFTLYKGNSKVIDANNSYDYHASQVKVGELVNNRYVTKTLVTNNPVEAIVTFSGVARDVSKLAKIQIFCSGHAGRFFIEFRDVRVN